MPHHCHSVFIYFLLRHYLVCFFPCEKRWSVLFSGPTRNLSFSFPFFLSVMTVIIFPVAQVPILCVIDSSLLYSPYNWHILCLPAFHFFLSFSFLTRLKNTDPFHLHISGGDTVLFSVRCCFDEDER